MTSMPDRMFADLPSGLLLQRVLIWQPIGLLLMAVHVLLMRQSVWLFPVVPCLVGWLYVNASLAGALVFFQILIYQNLMVSLFSPGMAYMPTFVVLGGTNFAVLGLMAVIAFNRLLTPYWWQQSRGIIWLVLAALAMMVCYSLFGAIKAGPTSAMVYFRTFASPLFAVLVGIDLGRTWGYKTIGSVFIFSVALSIALGIIEYFIPLDYYGWTNQVDYYQLKYTMQPEGNVFWSPADIVTHFTNAFMNISGSGTANDSIKMSTFRFGGSIITPTSFAYILSVVGIVAVSLRRSGWMVLIGPLMFLVGAKGASLLFILSLALYAVWTLTSNKRVVIVAGVVLSVGYIASGIIIGLQNNDYHVIGFMGGVHSLMSTPWGHGLGVGGNMSADANAGFKMDGPGGFTRLGADFALESAIGVLFFQTGLASIMVFLVFIGLLVVAPLGELRGRPLFFQGKRLRVGRVVPIRQDLMFFAVAMILVNGVFQEEAYSPYAAGTIMLLCSVIIGNGRRQHMTVASNAKRRLYSEAVNAGVSERSNVTAIQ